MEDIEQDIDYAFHLTMYEVLELALHHCDQAKKAENLIIMGFRLKQASRALRSALEIYGSHLEEVLKRGTEEQK
jgi:hypothetical protein